MCGTYVNRRREKDPVTVTDRAPELAVAHGYQWIPHHDREVASWIEEHGRTDRQVSDR